MQTLEELRATGIARLGIVPWADGFLAHLAKAPRYPGHVNSRPRQGIWHNAMADVVRAPDFLDYAKSFTTTAGEYFGEPAHLWSLNAFYTDHTTPHIPSIHGWHKDREASKILVLFKFGTDTYMDGAQLLDNGHAIESICGPKGTAWLADTTHEHCGRIPAYPRTLVWARFANCVPQAKTEEQLPDIP